MVNPIDRVINDPVPYLSNQFDLPKVKVKGSVVI